MTDHDQPTHKPTPDFREYVARDIVRAMRHNARFTPPVKSESARRFWLIAASALGTVVALGAGLAFGASTGYASARMEAGQRIGEMTANANDVTRQMAAIRLGIARTRDDITREAASKHGAVMPSLQKAASDLGIIETAMARIEQNIVTSNATTTHASNTPDMPMKRALAIACTALAANTVPAKPASVQQNGVPTVDLPPAAAQTKAVFGGVTGIRQTAGGKVLINDGRNRQVYLFDSTLTTSTVVIDSTSGTARSYGSPWAVALIPYSGDSSVFAHFESQTLLVLNARGDAVRTIAPPTAGSPLNALIATDDARFDPRGRLIFKDSPGTMMTHQVTADGVRHERVVEPPDSAAILRADLDARRVDTLGRIMQPNASGGKMSTVPSADGRGTVMKFTINPLASVDEFAVLSDGTVAFVRGHDYHVDWLLPDGTTRSTPKLPFDWKRLTDEDKQKLLDSARVAHDAAAARRAAAAAASPPPSMGDRGAVAGGMRGSGGASGGGRGGRGDDMLTDYVSVSEVADYYPPIRHAAAKGDADGNLWILPTTSAQSKNGELVYDVINVKDGLFERVRLPAGRSIAGFAKGGVVYLIAGSVATGFTVERTKLPARKAAPK